ncbi:hypothetical protein IW262DRAFT_1461712 [Armillaria fumosa]|nr:hypothetical protein IW262DRAFT_1461712 [Armillaria fumosa]
MSWLNTILYTSQAALSIYYLRHFTATRWLRSWIFASLFIDGTCLIAAMVGDYMILALNQDPSHTLFTWASKAAVLLTYSSASIAHVFFCHRYWTISRNKWITGWIVFLITANMLGTLVSTVITSLGPGILVLAVPLVLYEFFHMRNNRPIHRSFSGLDVLAHTNAACKYKKVEDSPIPNLVLSTIDDVFTSLLRRAAIQALTCGFTTAIFTTVMSISIFIVWNIFFSIFAVLGRIYSLTILITLILLKVMNRSDLSSSRVDGNSDSSEPAVLGTICFNHALDTEAGKRQSSNDGNFDTTHPSTHLTFTTISNDQIFTHTV